MFWWIQRHTPPTFFFPIKMVCGEWMNPKLESEFRWWTRLPSTNRSLICCEITIWYVSSLRRHVFPLEDKIFSRLRDPQGYSNPEEFRQWVKKCVETEEIDLKFMVCGTILLSKNYCIKSKPRLNRISAPILRHPACKSAVYAKKLEVWPTPWRMIAQKLKSNIDEWNLIR